MSRSVLIVLWLVLTMLYSSVRAEDQADAEVSTKNESSKKYLLKYHYISGEEWHYQLLEKETQEAISPVGNQTAHNDSSQWKHYRVVETHDDGSATLEVTMDRYRIHFKVVVGEEVQNELKYDSSEQQAPPKQLDSLKHSLGKPFARIHLSPSGEVMTTEFLQAKPVDGMEQTQKLQGLPMSFPENPIALGESWTHKLPVKLPVGQQLKFQQPIFKNFHVQTIYTLESVKDSQARITFKTLIQPRLTDPSLRGRMMKYLPTGEVVFDLDQGKILSRYEEVDRREINVGGPKTAMIVLSKKIERLVDTDQKVSKSE